MSAGQHSSERVVWQAFLQAPDGLTDEELVTLARPQPLHRPVAAGGAGAGQ